MDHSKLAVPDILLTPYVFYDIVSSGRMDQFDLAIDILEELVIFGKAFHVRISGGRELLHAMKLKYVLELLKNQAHCVSRKIEKYFPSKSRLKQKKQDALCRKFLTTLTVEKELQITFFERDYAREFGTEFLQNMQQMSQHLLLNIVPVSEIIKEVRTEEFCLLDKLNMLYEKRSHGVQDMKSILSLSISYRKADASNEKDEDIKGFEGIDEQSNSDNGESKHPYASNPGSKLNKNNRDHEQMNISNENYEQNYENKDIKKGYNKSKKSLFELMNNSEKVEKEREDSNSWRKLSSSTQVSSQSRQVPNIKVEMFYTKVKKKDIMEQTKLDTETDHSAMETTENHTVSDSIDLFQRRSCIGNKTKRDLRSTNEKVRRKHKIRTSKPKKETSFKVSQNNIESSDEHLSGTDHIHYEGIVDRNDNKVPLYFGDKGRPNIEKEILIPKAANLTWPDIIIPNNETSEKENNDNKSFRMICDGHAPEIRFSNHDVEDIDTCESLLFELKIEGPFTFETKPEADEMYSQFDNVDLSKIDSRSTSKPIQIMPPEELCAKETSLEYLDIRSNTRREYLPDEVSDIDMIIPPSVEASPKSPGIGIFEEDATYLDNEVQYIPDFSKFLKQADLNEV